MEPLRTDDPERLGGYQLLARLGEGGMGVVYLGRSVGGRAVAVKVIRERFAGDVYFRAQFRREASAARQVSGAFSAAVLDVSPEAGTPWLATAFLPGLSLLEAVETFGVFRPAAAKALGAGVAEALVDVHRAGVAHRDLKPGNIMLTRDGPRVIDFGIARPEDATAITDADTVVGTPAYMSPEQAAGQSAGPASDVFSLGAVLVFALVGKLPTGTDQPARSRPWARLVTAELGGTTPGGATGAGAAAATDGLTEVVLDCLRLDPWSRPSAVDLLARLAVSEQARPEAGGWLSAPLLDAIDQRAAQARDLLGPPVGRRRPSARSLAKTYAPTADPLPADPLAETDGARPPSRRTLILFGAGAAVATAAAAAAGTAVLLSRPRRAREPADAATDLTKRAATSSPDATSSAAPPRLVPRWQAKVSDYYPDVFTAGGNVVVAVTREAETIALDAADGRVRWRQNAYNGAYATGELVLLHHSQQPFLTAVDPASGDTVWATSEFNRGFKQPVAVGAVLYGAAGIERSQVAAVGSADGTTRWVANADTSGGLAAGPDVVVALGGSAMVGLDPGDGRTRWTFPMAGANQASWRLPLVSEGLVFASTSSGGLQAVRTSDGTPVWSSPDDNGGSLQAADGLLFRGDGQDSVGAVDAASGTPRWSRELGAACLLRLAGQTLVAGCLGDGTVYGLATDDGRVLWTYGVDLTPTSAPTSTADTADTAFVGTRAGNVEALQATSDGG